MCSDDQMNLGLFAVQQPGACKGARSIAYSLERTEIGSAVWPDHPAGRVDER